MQSIAPSLRAIDRFLCLRHYPTRVLANQNIASHLRKSGRLSGHHAQAAKGWFYSHSRVARLNTNATSKYRSEGSIFPYTFSRLINTSLAIVPFWFGGIETWLGLFLEQTHTLHYHQMSALAISDRSVFTTTYHSSPCRRFFTSDILHRLGCGQRQP